MTRQSRLHRDVSHGPGATADADGGHFAGTGWEDQVRPQKPWYLHGKTQENHVLNGDSNGIFYFLENKF